MSLKIVLCIGESDPMWGLAAKIAKRMETQIVGVVVESRSGVLNRVRFFKDRLKKYGVIALCDQLLLLLYKWVTFKGHDPQTFKESHEYLSRFSILRVFDINDPRVSEFIKKKEAHFSINIGTGKVKRPGLKAPTVAAINVHAGLNPRYRGVDPTVWTIYEKNFKDLGGTIHLMDEGLDTGKILFRTRMSLKENDNLENISVRSREETIEGLCEVLKFYEKHHTYPELELEPLEAKTYGWYGLKTYLKANANLRDELYK